MNVYIHKPVNYSDMQGPCDSGFHIPTKDEWDSIVSIGTTLGVWGRYNGAGISTYLKMPFAGYRSYSNSNVSSQGTSCYYWAQANNGSNRMPAYYIDSSNIYSSSSGRSYGCVIRAFRNTPSIPDSSWTVLYQGTGDAGVYHNSTLGIISLSSDGTTWITIADKNLGATTVYNNGDTLSESNCGKYYQRGNNYGFPYTGSVTTSSTKIDVSNYGPGNYYSSSTFITTQVGDSNYDWANPQNDNLRGIVSGLGGESELQNAYIGEYEFSIKYQQVEYIQTSGTQFIDTGITPQSNIQIETKVSVVTTSQGLPVFGNYVDNSALYTSGNFYHLTCYSSKWYWGLNGSESNGGTYSPTVGTQYEIIYNNSDNQVLVNGSSLGSSSGTAGYTGTTLAISVRGNNYTNNKYYGQYKYYYFNVFNKTTGEYERQMIPCYRKSDGVIGMYDLVNDTFYTNQGTGTFTKGPDVN